MLGLNDLCQIAIVLSLGLWLGLSLDLTKSSEVRKAGDQPICATIFLKGHLHTTLKFEKLMLRIKDLLSTILLWRLLNVVLSPLKSQKQNKKYK